MQSVLEWTINRRRASLGLVVNQGNIPELRYSVTDKNSDNDGKKSREAIDKSKENGYNRRSILGGG